VFVDDFDDDHIDPYVWSVEIYGSGAQIAEQNQQLEFFMPSFASGEEFGTRLLSDFQLRGDFDIRVDFRLLEWQSFNGMRIAIGLTHSLFDDYGVERSSLSSREGAGVEVYVADFGPFVLVPTSDSTGTLRLVRTGATQTAYYHSDGTWVPILSDDAPPGDAFIQLHGWSHDYAFEDHDVRAAFDNFTVMSGEVIWPTTPVRTVSWGAVRALYR